MRARLGPCSARAIGRHRSASVSKTRAHRSQVRVLLTMTTCARNYAAIPDRTEKPPRFFLVGAITVATPILADRASMHPPCFNRADSQRRSVLQALEKRGENVVVAETRVRIPLGHGISTVRMPSAPQNVGPVLFVSYDCYG